MRQRAQHSTSEKARVEAFSDGVFAIAMTLLVLELHVPVGMFSSRALGAALMHAWPSYFAFALSFLTVLIMWVNHHEMFTSFAAVDTPMLFANGYLMMVVTAVPFPTALVAEYLTTPARNAAACAYGLLFVLINLGYTALWRSALSNEEVLRDVPERAVRNLNNSLTIALIGYAGGALLSLVNGYLGIGVYLAQWLFWTWRPIANGIRRRAVAETQA